MESPQVVVVNEPRAGCELWPVGDRMGVCFTMDGGRFELPPTIAESWSDSCGFRSVIEFVSALNGPGLTAEQSVWLVLSLLAFAEARASAAVSVSRVFSRKAVKQ